MISDSNQPEVEMREEEIVFYPNPPGPGARDEASTHKKEIEPTLTSTTSFTMPTVEEMEQRDR